MAEGEISTEEKSKQPALLVYARISGNVLGTKVPLSAVNPPVEGRSGDKMYLKLYIPYFAICKSTYQALECLLRGFLPHVLVDDFVEGSLHDLIN